MSELVERHNPSERQNAFRAAYKSDIHPLYNGVLHIGVIYVVGIAVIAWCLAHLQQARWEWLLIVPVFFGAIADGHWPGQFNADFLSMLGLSALWTGWRNGWSALGWVLALCAFFLGGGFLMGYLLVLLHRERGDMRRVLLGVQAGA